MNAMAVSHTGDARRSMPRQQGMAGGRQSLYAAARIKSPTPPQRSQTLSPRVDYDTFDASFPFPSPQAPLSPRWDASPEGVGAHVLKSPKSSAKFYLSQVPRPEQPHPQPHPRTQHAGTGTGTGTGRHPVRDTSEIIVLETQTQSQSQSQSPSEIPLSPKSPISDRHAHNYPPVENFSRPRKPSVKHSAPSGKLRLAHVPPPLDLMPEFSESLPPTPVSSHHQHQHQHQPQQQQQQQSPRSTPSLPSASPSFPLSNDILEPRTARTRDGSSPPVSVSRPPYGFTRINSTASVPTPSGSAPWASGDDPQSSYRFQFTASAVALGTSFTTSTKRSSALSKVSSVSSLDDANPDEPSLEDVMGMYERGFCDDDDEDEDDEEEEYRDDQDHDQLDGKPEGSTLSLMTRRPMTAMSEPARYSGAVIDPFGGSGGSDEPIPPLPPVPAAQAALDAEIRQSKMLFASLAFTSTVPAMASHTLSFSHRRESARTIESEHSMTSDSHHHDIQPVTVHVSGPSISVSRSASPLSTQLPLAEPEDPNSRDRYGFKKESQYVTQAQYDSWNKDYSPYLERRRKKWIAYLRDSALMTDRPNRFPAPNTKTKRYVRKGIPPDWRGAAWFYYAGGPAILAKHSGLYDKLLLRKASQIDIEAIERDLHRTFPDNIRFKPSGFAADRLETTTSSERASQSTMAGGTTDGSGPGPKGLEGEPPIISALRRVLLAFSVYNPKIGYCQSLNFIAGLLLLFVETEEQCFWLLNVVTHIYLPGTHEMSLEGSKVDLGVLMTELRDTMPAVWDKIGGELETEPVTRPRTSKSIRKSPRTPRLRRKDMPGLSTERLPPITLCMTAWFMSCYIGTLPIETTLRVWDVFFYEGSKTLFRVALSIFKIGESEIKAVSDPMEMFGVVQTMPRRMLDANQVMEMSFKRRNGFNHLSQDVIEERRQERREKVRQDLQRGKTVTGSNGASGGTESHHKGLFGKKK